MGIMNVYVHIEL